MTTAPAASKVVLAGGAADLIVVAQAGGTTFGIHAFCGRATSIYWVGGKKPLHGVTSRPIVPAWSRL